MANLAKQRCRRALAGVLVLLPVFSIAAPGDILFNDGFEDGTLAPWTSSNASRSGVSNAAGFAGAGAFGAFTRYDAVTVTSPSFNASVPEARLALWIRRGADSFSEDTDTGEDLVLEYRRANNSWGSLRTYLGSGTNGQVYNEVFILPPDALHNNLALRLRQTAGSGVNFDYWHFDRVVVTEIAPATQLGVGSCDDFENGLTANWSIAASGGFAGVSSATSQSPTNSMYLNGGVVTVTSNVVDTSTSTFGDLTFWIRRGSDAFSEDPDTNENLVVEYLNSGSTWTALETFTGAGGPGQIFTRTIDLPASGRHAGFRLRFRMTGGSGAAWDYWHIDDVCLELSTDPVLQVVKVAQVVSDPINGTTDPRAIPGAAMRYTVAVTNTGLGTIDAGTVVITDGIPPNTEMYVSTASGDPVTFTDGSTPSGLTFNYATDVSYTNLPGGVGPYVYTPVPDAQGFDVAVTGFRVNPSGPMDGSSGGNNPSFNLSFTVRIQ